MSTLVHKKLPRDYEVWANAHALPVFVLSAALIIVFVPGFHWVMQLMLPQAYDSLTVRIVAILPTLLFSFWIYFFPSSRKYLLTFQVLQISAMLGGMIWVSGVAGFPPYYLAASLLGVVGAALTLQTRKQVFIATVASSLWLLLFFVFNSNVEARVPLSFYLSAGIITVSLALVKVLSHEKEFALRSQLAQAMEELEMERAKSYAQAEQAFVGELASSLAHEINTPLATLSGSIQLVQRNMPSHEEAIHSRHLKRALEQGHRIKLFIDKLLYFTGSNVLDQKSLDLEALIQLATALIRPLAIKYQVAVELTISNPKLAVRSSDKDFTQALFHLLKNAVEAAAETPKPRWVRIHVFVDQVSQQIVVQVIDSGPGILPANTEKIFQPFTSFKDKSEHHGLGLSTIKHLLEKNSAQVLYLKNAEHTTFEMRFLPANSI